MPLGLGYNHAFAFLFDERLVVCYTIANRLDGNASINTLVDVPSIYLRRLKRLRSTPFESMFGILRFGSQGGHPYSSSQSATLGGGVQNQFYAGEAYVRLIVEAGNSRDDYLITHTMQCRHR